MSKIVVFLVEKIHYYPPTITLVHVLLDLGHEVTLVSRGIKDLDDSILHHKRFRYVELDFYENERNLFTRVITRISEKKEVKKQLINTMKSGEILWTVSMRTIRDLQTDVLNYKNVLQMMELYRYGYSSKLVKFSLEEIARKSWKNVVAEENRAYIQKAWWKLDRTPIVLPNKPYSLEYGAITSDMSLAIEKIKREHRKIVLYLGGIFPDRNLEEYANAISRLNDKYVLYIIGKAYNVAEENRLKTLVNNYRVEYLGYFDPPKHLAFVKYASIGLLPYRPIYNSIQSELNAIYCAPNKIFEYAGYGIPMIGSDVIGLKYPFEKWNIGVVCDDNSEEMLFDAIKYIDENYKEMSHNCKVFFENVDIMKIVAQIIES